MIDITTTAAQLADLHAERIRVAVPKGGPASVMILASHEGSAGPAVLSGIMDRRLKACGPIVFAAAEDLAVKLLLDAGFSARAILAELDGAKVDRAAGEVLVLVVHGQDAEAVVLPAPGTTVAAPPPAA